MIGDNDGRRTGKEVSREQPQRGKQMHRQRHSNEGKRDLRAVTFQNRLESHDDNILLSATLLSSPKKPSETDESRRKGSEISRGEPQRRKQRHRHKHSNER